MNFSGGRKNDEKKSNQYFTTTGIVTGISLQVVPLSAAQADSQIIEAGTSQGTGNKKAACKRRLYLCGEEDLNFHASRH